MTRKRFIKLLMARGLTRNEATRCANWRPYGKPYANYYEEILWRVELACMGRRLMNKMRKAIEPLVAAITEAVGVLNTKLQAIFGPAEAGGGKE